MTSNETANDIKILVNQIQTLESQRNMRFDKIDKELMKTRSMVNDGLAESRSMINKGLEETRSMITKGC
jgi:hypothetical protein